MESEKIALMLKSVLKCLKLLNIKGNFIKSFKDVLCLPLQMFMFFLETKFSAFTVIFFLAF